MTTENKVLLGVGAGVGGLYLIANVAPTDEYFQTDAVLSSVDPSVESGSSTLWIYIIAIIVILALGAYIAREVAG